ncbi:MAG: hypothetical protein LUF30_07300 [Lachnospiraceae bacterium]|nr:hypothetical protein [Lachnospiraceae bacterium]
MTSKISFSKMIRAEMRQMNWMTVVQMVVFFLLIPFRVLMTMALRENDLSRYGSSSVLTAEEQFNNIVGLGHVENTLVILACGSICALVAFGYLHSQVKQEFYLSLSLKRRELCAVQVLSSLLTFVGGYLICQVLGILVGLIYQAVTLKTVLEIVLASLQGILFYLCGYMSALVVMMLAGNFLTTILGIAAFGLYLPLMHVLWESFTGVFWTTQVQEYTSSISWLKWTSPWAWCLAKTYMPAEKVVPGFGDFCQIIVILAALTLVSVLLYRIRKTEVAGKALAFPYLEPVIKMMVAVPVALTAGLVGYELFESITFEIFLIVLFGALPCVVIEFIYRVDIRQVLSHKWHFAVALVISFAIFFAFRFDLAGFNTYLPAESEVEAMSITPYRSMYASRENESGDAWSGAMRNVMDLVYWEDFDGMYEVAENGVENIEKYGYSYNETSDEDATEVYVKFYLKNGQEIYRVYQVSISLFYEVMDELLIQDDFLDQYIPIFSWDDEEKSRVKEIYCSVYGYDEDDLFGAVPEPEEETETDTGLESNTELETDVQMEPEADTTETAENAGESAATEEVVSDYDYKSVSLNIPEAKLEELLEAYREDLKNVSAEELLEGTGEIYIYAGSNYAFDRYTFSIAFTNTLAVLRETYDRMAYYY